MSPKIKSLLSPNPDTDIQGYFDTWVDNLDKILSMSKSDRDRILGTVERVFSKNWYRLPYSPVKPLDIVKIINTGTQFKPIHELISSTIDKFPSNHNIDDIILVQKEEGLNSLIASNTVILIKIDGCIQLDPGVYSIGGLLDKPPTVIEGREYPKWEHVLPKGGKEQVSDSLTIHKYLTSALKYKILRTTIMQNDSEKDVNAIGTRNLVQFMGKMVNPQQLLKLITVFRKLGVEEISIRTVPKKVSPISIIGGPITSLIMPVNYSGMILPEGNKFTVVPVVPFTTPSLGKFF